MISENQEIIWPGLAEKNIRLYLKREDLLHPWISGNKFRKLKYNIEEAQKQGVTTLLTFGGAFSNHISATAYAGHKYGFKTIGVIRGEELEGNWSDNPTLKQAYDHGMRFRFISRTRYREKESRDFIDSLRAEIDPFYLVPEGGTNTLAVKGCTEILTPSDTGFDFVCTAVGTGGTIAGLSQGVSPNQHVLGFPALKGDFLKKEIKALTPRDNWTLVTDYHFGGYAKMSKELVGFINDFKQVTGIPLDPVYTGKMMFGILDMISTARFSEGSRILAIHTGGLQGIAGMNQKLQKKNLPLIA
jgi:1-aminocyclopropane-1-carboxylate deaminase